VLFKSFPMNGRILVPLVYASAHTPLHTYAKDRQSVQVNVDNATINAVMVIINEYWSLYKCIKQRLTINKLFTMATKQAKKQAPTI
jgi:hypothetical protein